MVGRGGGVVVRLAKGAVGTEGAGLRLSPHIPKGVVARGLMAGVDGGITVGVVISLCNEACNPLHAYTRLYSI